MEEVDVVDNCCFNIVVVKGREDPFLDCCVLMMFLCIVFMIYRMRDDRDLE